MGLVRPDRWWRTDDEPRGRLPSIARDINHMQPASHVTFL